MGISEQQEQEQMFSSNESIINYEILPVNGYIIVERYEGVSEEQENVFIIPSGVCVEKPSDGIIVKVIEGPEEFIGKYIIIDVASLEEVHFQGQLIQFTKLQKIKAIITIVE
jgi:hypothetical protein